MVRYPHDMVRYPTTWSGTTRHGPVPHDMVRYHTTCSPRHGQVPPRHGQVPHDMVRYHTTWSGTTRHGPVPHDMVRYHTTWSGTTRHRADHYMGLPGVWKSHDWYSGFCSADRVFEPGR